MDERGRKGNGKEGERHGLLGDIWDRSPFGMRRATARQAKTTQVVCTRLFSSAVFSLLVLLFLIYTILYILYILLYCILFKK